MRLSKPYKQLPLPGTEGFYSPLPNRGVKNGDLPISTSTKKWASKYEELASTQSKLPILNGSRLLFHDIEASKWGNEMGCMIYRVRSFWLSKEQLADSIALDILETANERPTIDVAKKRAAELVKIKIMRLRSSENKQ